MSTNPAGTAGTLVNKKRSGFVRTPPQLAVQIGTTLLALPEEPFHVYDPTSGEGDFFLACAHARRARRFGSEISAERADVSRQRWPDATILTAPFETISIQGQMQLLLSNPPYFFQNGKRAPYRIIVDAGRWLQPGGVHVAIMTARSDWNAEMIGHWLTWYDQVRVWKFPDRLAEDDEHGFDDYTQLCVAGVRRTTAIVPDEAQRTWLRGYAWKKHGWCGTPPPDLPTTPLPDPYVVPSSFKAPQMIARNADTALLLSALNDSGSHLSPVWKQVTTWTEEEGDQGAPAMPYTGEAHIASEVMVGGLDGEIVWGPGSGPDAHPHLFSAFIGKDWVQMPIEDELKQKLREQGCIRVEMRQMMDKPILGVLDLLTGRSQYYQGDDVFGYLQPWIPTLAARVIAKRQPLYRLDPAPWEVRVLSQFGTDKRLPNATHAGLAVAQMHRVFAMGRSLDVKGSIAIQGEPGTGKTRMATATAARQAYRWRHRLAEFRATPQPAWVSGLRRAWLHTPKMLALLGLEPVYGWHVSPQHPHRHAVQEHAPRPSVIAYRHLATGQMLTPEQAGPRALPVLIVTPLKVTKEYGKEIRAAFPQAEVMAIESHRDIMPWLERCASSRAPVVFGVLSHSLTRAFGRERHAVVREKVRVVKRVELDPPEALLETLEPMYTQKGTHQRLTGYVVKATGKLLTKEVRVSTFYCGECGGRIDAVPGTANQPDPPDQRTPKRGEISAPDARDERDDPQAAGALLPVTSRTWFSKKLRWCTCDHARNAARREQGQPLLRAPLWQEERSEATTRKFPHLPFAAWSAACTTVQKQAAQALATASLATLTDLARRDESLLTHLVQMALLTPETARMIQVLVERVDGEVTRVRQRVEEHRAALATLLLPLVKADLCEATSLSGDALTRLLVDLAERDFQTLRTCVTLEPTSEQQAHRLVAQVREQQARLVERIVQAVRRDASHHLLLRLVEETRAQVNWQAILFQQRWKEAHGSPPVQTKKRTKKQNALMETEARQGTCGVRLAVVADGPLAVEEIDRDAARGYEAMTDEAGRLVACQLGHQGKRLVPLYGISSRRVVGYVEQETGTLVTKTTHYGFCMPPADSFSPYEYLYRFFRGAVGLAVIDESHNGRGRRTDIGRAHHFAMLSSQMRALTSGTHFGGDIAGFYHYWFRYRPQFWLTRGYRWGDVEKALADYGVIEKWLKEYQTEGDARQGSGKTDLSITEVPGPGLSANLIPGLLEDLTYLTVLDVGAHMPPKQELPKAISMTHPTLDAMRKQEEQQVADAQRQVTERLAERRAWLETSTPEPSEALAWQAHLTSLTDELRQAEARLKEARQHRWEVTRWIDQRDLAGAYARIVGSLEDKAKDGNPAARLALGTVPRWFASLPCDAPYEVYQSTFGAWGDREGRELVIKTPVLAWDFLYPMEEWYIAFTREELAAGRRVMFYIEQVSRSMARRLEWVLKAFGPWSLPENVKPEDRQQAILDAVERGHQVVIVPYKKVNEGLNLQRAIDTIVWVELAMNLFYYTQASQRAWRLGKEELVKIVIPYYIGSATHKKVRSIGGRDGAAAAFAGEPTTGGLAHHVGADRTMLARLAAQIEQGEEAEPVISGDEVDDSNEIEASFARRNEELAQALQRGRQWFGLVDRLPEQLAAILATRAPDLWAELPTRTHAPETGAYLLASPITIEVQPEAAEPSVDEREVVTPVALLPTTLEDEQATPPVTAPAQETPVLHVQITVASMPSGKPGSVTFGDEQDILRVRKLRAVRPRRTQPKPKNPTVVTHIAALDETSPSPEAPSSHPALVLPSLWDSSDAF